MNTFDRPDGTLVIDACRYESMFAVDSLGPSGDSLARHERWEIDPERGTSRSP